MEYKLPEDVPVQPLRDLVLLKWIPNDTTEMGIFIPKTDTFEYIRGEVVAFGKDCKYVQVGDKVIAEKYARADRVSYHNDLHAFISESSIFVSYD